MSLKNYTSYAAALAVHGEGMKVACYGPNDYRVWDANGNPPWHVEPTTPMPDLSPRQIRQALTAAGKRAAVEAGVAASSQDVKDWWEFATSFERNHPVILAMLPALGITKEQADAVWLLGASL